MYDAFEESCAWLPIIPQDTDEVGLTDFQHGGEGVGVGGSGEPEVTQEVERVRRVLAGRNACATNAYRYGWG